MKAPALLRIASAVAFVQFAGHGALFIRARPTHGADEVAERELRPERIFERKVGPTLLVRQDLFGKAGEADGICCLRRRNQESEVCWAESSFDLIVIVGRRGPRIRDGPKHRLPSFGA